MRILVTGARGLVGGPLADRLEDAGQDVLRAGRRSRASGWLAWDMGRPGFAFDGRLDCVVHAAPLWLLPGHMEALAQSGVERVIAYSSTSAVTKQHSASAADRALAESLSRAESALRTASSRFGIRTTVFRPTMIYGYGRDANVSAIAGFIRRYGFFPVAGRGAGRRRPVHVDDCVAAALAVLDNSDTVGRTYDLGGGEVLTYRQMVARIFRALGRPARIVRVPIALYQGVLALARLAGGEVTASMAARMDQDMAFDPAEARADFGFAPQGFLEHPERDLPKP